MDIKGFKKTLEYHVMVWRTAGEETASYFLADFRNWFGNFAVAILSGLAYAYWSYIKQDTMIDWTGVVVSVLIGFAGWGVLVFLGNLIWTTPAKLYRGKQIIADKITWNDIDINIKKFPLNTENPFAYGLEFKSKKPFIVSVIRAELVWSKRETGDHSYNPPVRLPVIYGRTYNWDDAVIDEKGGSWIFCVFSVYPDYPEKNEYRAIMPKGGQPGYP